MNPNKSLWHQYSFNKTSYKKFSISSLTWEYYDNLSIKDINKIKLRCPASNIRLLNISNNKIQTIPKSINKFTNLLKLNITKNPITYISSQGIWQLQELNEVHWDWWIYLQSGELDKRSIVTQSTEFTIQKFKAIFQNQNIENERSNPVIKMSSGASDLIHFTLFICKALELEDEFELGEQKRFFSIKNKSIRGILQLATELDHHFIVEQLIRSSINVNSVDKGNQSAFDIAVAEDRKIIKSILLKRNDLITHRYNVELSEHPLRICILDKDQKSARLILENVYFKNYMAK